MKRETLLEDKSYSRKEQSERNQHNTISNSKYNPYRPTEWNNPQTQTIMGIVLTRKEVKGEVEKRDTKFSWYLTTHSGSIFSQRLEFQTTSIR